MSDLVPHIPGLRRYARLLTGDATRADDLVQDTLERALRKWHLFDGGADASLRSWLLTVMHNVWASQMRSQRPEDPFGDDEEAQHYVDPAQDPSLATALRLDTQRALATLPDAQRSVLLLVVVEDLSYAEVARVLDVPIGTVMSRLSRARAAMRDHLSAPAVPQPLAQSVFASGAAPPATPAGRPPLGGAGPLPRAYPVTARSASPAKTAPDAGPSGTIGIGRPAAADPPPGPDTIMDSPIEQELPPGSEPAQPTVSGRAADAGNHLRIVSGGRQ